MSTDQHTCSNGPVATLPGVVSIPTHGTTCDKCNLLATRRVQGETDSMGCEYLHYCDVHYEEDKAALDAPVESTCDWCGREAQLKPMRDSDEGLAGPVYYVCTPCCTKEIQARREF